MATIREIRLNACVSEKKHNIGVVFTTTMSTCDVAQNARCVLCSHGCALSHMHALYFQDSKAHLFGFCCANCYHLLNFSKTRLKSVPAHVWFRAEPGGFRDGDQKCRK